MTKTTGSYESKSKTHAVYIHWSWTDTEYSQNGKKIGKQPVTFTGKDESLAGKPLFNLGATTPNNNLVFCNQTGRNISLPYGPTPLDCFKSFIFGP